MNILRGMLLTLLLLSSPLLLCVLAAPPTLQRPMEIVEATIEGGSIATVDPAACYDTASGELLMNCYDTLVCFDGEYVDKYLPQLATEWVIVQNNGTKISANTGLEFFYTYYFKIRTGVQWQNSVFGTVTPADVEYTFERGMVLEPGDNPQWMFYEPLLNGATMAYIDGHDVDPGGNLTERAWVGWAIDEAVESNSTHVWFNLCFEGTYAPFMQILCQPWSSIICKAYVNSLGRATNWNGDFGVDHQAYYAYHFPAVPPLDDPTYAVMGAGPFILAHLDQALHYWDANRFTNYWRGWGSGPAPNYGIDWPAFGSSKPAGYINHYKVTWAYDWPTRSTMFLNGDVDFCEVPRQYTNSMLGQPGIRCIYPLPSLTCDALFYNFDIAPTTPYGTIYDYGQLNESGIPRDFFGNSSWGMHTRKAFACCIDYGSWLSENYGDDAQRPGTAIIPGIPYYDPTVPRYDFNLTRAGEEFKQVSTLWETGFTINLAYLVWCGNHNPIKSSLFNLIKQAVESLNPKFHVTVSEVQWCFLCCEPGPENFPMSIFGWLADYPDPHNFAYPFYYSEGNFASRVGYSNPTMDALVAAGIATPDGPQRAQIYHDLQQFVIDDCPSVVLHQSFGRHFERDWICGWYYNLIYPGVYAANLWKWYYTPQAQLDTVTNATANLLPYDVNYDGKTNMYDIGAAAASFGAVYGPPISPKWNFRRDFNNDRMIDMKDIAGVAKNFGKTSNIWTPSS